MIRKNVLIGEFVRTLFHQIFTYMTVYLLIMVPCSTQLFACSRACTHTHTHNVTNIN